MTDEDPWKAEFDEHMVTVMNMSAESFWPALAVACAMADEGLLDKARLLQIVDAIIGHVSAEQTGGLAPVEDVVKPLTDFRDVLEALRLDPGRVVEELQLHEAASGLSAVRRVRNSRRSSE